MLECKRCGNKWEPRIKKSPKQCPKCKSPNWNQKRLSRKEIEKIIKARVENSKMNMESICKVLDSTTQQAGVKWSTSNYDVNHLQNMVAELQQDKSTLQSEVERLKERLKNGSK
jgi:hypothetical protein